MSFYTTTMLILLALLNLLAVGDASCTCGLSGGTKNRIVGGQTAKEGTYPWMVAIYKTKWPYDVAGSIFMCGGTLINNNFVLTAAHCLKKLTPSTTIIILGDNNRKNVSFYYEKKAVRNFISHENYSNSYTTLNDIALLELEFPLEVSTLSTICLPSQEVNLTGKTGTVIGWGALNGNVREYDSLREANVKILPDEVCHKSYKKNPRYFNEKKFCAGEGGKDTCSGDSGGPFLIKNEDNQQYTQVGITSGGVSCGRKEYPGTYVKVSRYIKWIDFHTRHAAYCSNSVLS